MSVNKITVIICTCNRPDMLREALQSVSIQTASEAIDKVLVSENGSNPESKSVCAEFANLPIQYIYQDPPIAPLYHFQTIATHISSEYTAVLHDDDWWAADHLERSCITLEADNAIATVFSNFVELESPKHTFTLSYKTFRIWAFTGCDFSRASVTMEPESNFLCSLWDTSYHFSSCVGKSRWIKSAVDRIVETGNGYDTDRMFAIFLGENGLIAYVPAITTYVRIHEGQDCARDIYQVNDEGWRRKAETTKWLVTHYPEQVSSAVSLYNEKILPTLRESDRLEIERPIGMPQREALSRVCGFHLSTMEKLIAARANEVASLSANEKKPLIRRMAGRLRRITRKYAKFWH